MIDQVVLPFHFVGPLGPDVIMKSPERSQRGTRAVSQTHVIKEWIDSTEDAISALQDWKAHFEGWERSDDELHSGDFDAAFNALYQAGLGDG